MRSITQNMFNMSIGRLVEFSLLFARWIFYNYTVVHGGGERLEG